MPIAIAFPKLGFRPWMMTRHEMIPSLERATLAYLLLPNLIFAAGWLRWYFALPVMAALGAAFIWSWKQSALWRDASWKPQLGPDKLSGWLLPSVLLVAAFWTWISGVGGYQFVTGDWIKHFSLFKSLQADAWPPSEYPAGRDFNWPICYYVAYYLPAALVGKVAGWNAACFALYAWTVAGLFLGLTWLSLLVGKRPFLAVTVFPFLGGLDWFGHTFVTGVAQPGREHLEWWAGWLTWEYSSNQTLMSWVPQHAVSSWLACGWILHQWLEDKGLTRAGLLAGLMPLWAPLVFIGLVPFAVMGFIMEKGRTCFTPGNFLGIVPALVSILMLLSHASPMPRNFYWDLIWIGPANWLNLSFFLLIEFGVFAFFADEFFRPTLPKLKILGITALGTLVLIPFYQMGMYNDFAMRSSQPALFVVWIFVLRSLFHHPRPQTRKLLTLTVLLCFFGSIGGWMPATDTPLGHKPPDGDQIKLLYGIDWPVAKQYQGNPESFFFKHMAKPFAVGPHVPFIPWPEGMWLSPEEEATPPGYPGGVRPKP